MADSKMGACRRQVSGALLSLLVVATVAFLAGCRPADGLSESRIPQDAVSIKTAASVRPGAAVLLDDPTILVGKRVGVIANHTALVDGVHLVDTLLSRGIDVTAIFAPEHGFRGDADAGQHIENLRDVRTGVPIFSIYGSQRAPAPGILDSLDVLLFDIQDVGARFYTYISSMGLSMQAAARSRTPFVVLDRPNPIGGEYVSGYVREDGFSSFVGLFPIPIAHGLTVGELATMIVGENWLDDVGDLDLTVIRMTGWQRQMLWPDTGLEWVAPSPNLPAFGMTLLYPGTCLVEATAASEGRGTATPFELIGAAWIDNAALVKRLDEKNLPGVAFSAESFTPVSIPGMSTSPKLLDTPLNGVRIRVTDEHAVLPVETGIVLLTEMHGQASESEIPEFIRNTGMGRLAGTDRLAQMLDAKISADSIVASWAQEVADFRRKRAPYLLY